MKQRCSNKKNKRFNRYGGRGITVCARWRTSFEAFLADMGPRPLGLTIDRVNNDGDYEPGNCRWATPREQTWNFSRNRLLTFNGESLPIAQWAHRLGFKRSAIGARLQRGWSVERALSTPLLSR
jgi:hypothetical protein